MIELMVVLVIVSVLTSLVGALVIDRLAKSQAKSETMEIQNIVRVMKYRAFVTSQKHKLVFEGKGLKIIVDDQVVKKITFKHVFFQPQVIILNSHGFSIQRYLFLIEGGKKIKLNISFVEYEQ